MRDAVLVLAGSDPLGYSGLQADLRHLTQRGARAYGIPTAFTVQSIDQVHQVTPVATQELAAALRVALADGPPACAKIGLLANAEQVAVCAQFLREARIPAVLDPVLAASAGQSFLDDEGLQVLRRELIALVTLVTPNLPELQRLTTMHVAGREDRIAAAGSLGAQAVLVKDGHGVAAVLEDLLIQGAQVTSFCGPRVSGVMPRGTGCMLSTLIAAELAMNRNLHEAVRAARTAVCSAIEVAVAAGTRRLNL